MNKLIIALTFITIFSGCVPQPQKTLSQKLEGKSHSESKEVLRLACLNKAEILQPKRMVKRVHGSIKLPDIAEVREMKNICREMYYAYSTRLSDKNNRKQVELAKRCEHRINTDLKNAKNPNMKHFENMSFICEKMTGQEIKKLDHIGFR